MHNISYFDMIHIYIYDIYIYILLSFSSVYEVQVILAGYFIPSTLS